MKKFVPALAVVLGVTGLAIPHPAHAAPSRTTAVADAYVNVRSQSVRHADAVTLKVDGTAGRRKQAFLKFTVPTVPAGQELSRVALRLRPLTSSKQGVRVHRTSRRWSEETLTWGSKPTGRTLLGASAAVQSGVTEVIELDASRIAPGRVLSVRVATSAQSPVSFASSEARTVAYRPSLSVRRSSATTPSPTQTPTSAGVQPTGVAGGWSTTFQDEFNGTSLDTSKWKPNWFDEGGSMNNVGTYADNVTVANGEARLQLSSSTRGALIHTGGGYRGDPNRYGLPVGGVAEARIWFPGNGSSLYNWSAWWANDTYDGVSGQPVNGEHDIAEILSSGALTVNYHSRSGAHNQGSVPGYWGDAFHTYTLHRKPASVDVYWDGRLVKSYSTDDSGAPIELILNVGSGQGTTVTGPAGAMRVDYVRAWEPAH
ncbi:DNRLRE domain-containing protein [Nocardioides xinjiangensis]|uniref:DNRLRE domain-containing protein n=1 Tax=Nocardioides xinjiangensis TaxID=2817376 RepID=UPI001B30739F|nr:DNRLRE domain-containing protein [Nocardioides sp. SYSU D00778]